jgi:DNA (cytosine-5)-methyltransferase 1
VRYLSVCSGIEAVSVAWRSLGWEPVAFSEIDPFACAVLKHHHPGVVNLGDLRRIAREVEAPRADVLVGGTPCQSFSVAGLRGGLADPRGNLALDFLRVLDGARARWCLWENVPGVLSVDDGRAFGAFLGGLAELGYGTAYRVLDAQHFGVPQRRRRVFVVGHLGDWRRAAAVLFERHSLQGHPPPSREEGAGVARSLGAGAGRSGGNTGNVGPMGTMRAGNGNEGGGVPFIAHTLKGDGFDGGEDGTGRGTPLVPVAFNWQNGGGYGDAHDGLAITEDGIGPLDASTTKAVAFHENQRGELTTADTAGALKTGGGKPGQGYPALASGMAVRRLTPRECERLQGFPDDYTLVTYRGKPAADGPRYRALGNSMATPVVRWIGERMARVEAVA